MSDKRATLRERTQRFRRRMRGKDRGVSPVVATLILILIAVAAAAALYLWLVAWQGNITGGIGNQQVQATFTIGGSTSVFPFSSAGVSWYEQNHSDVVINDQQGGTGAGMLAVCEGHVDVGAASTPETASGLEAADGCSAADNINVTVIAYDAVDVVINSANTHGLLSIGYDTLTAIYDSSSTTQPTLFPTTIDNTTTTSGALDQAPWYKANLNSLTPTALQWDQIPATVYGYSFSAGALTNGSANSTAITEKLSNATHPVAAGAGEPCGISTHSLNDICDAAVFGKAATGTPCGFFVCAGGTGGFASGSDNATASIVPIERLDASGTTQTFEAKLLGATSASGFGSSFAALGYSGCGSNNLLTDCGITLKSSQQANGNPGVLTAVAGNLNSLGYASDGLARTASGIGTGGIVPFLADGQSLISGSAGSTHAYGAVVPSTGASGTIAAGIKNSTTTNQYSGWRPFEFVTLNPPAGEVFDFYQFILGSSVNQALATATGEVSLYSI